MLGVFSCQNDFEDVEQKSNDSTYYKVRHVNITEIPYLIPEIKNAKNRANNSKARVYNKSFDLDSIIYNETNIIELTLENGERSYSIRIMNPDIIESYAFDNLHIEENIIGDLNGYVNRYVPDEQWYISNNYNFFIGTFTGSILKFDLDYNLQSTVNMISGQIVNYNENGRMQEGDCQGGIVCVSACEIGNCHEDGSTCGNTGSVLAYVPGCGGGTGGESGDGDLTPDPADDIHGDVNNDDIPEGENNPGGGAPDPNNNSDNPKPVIVNEPTVQEKVIDCLNLNYAENANLSVSNWVNNLDNQFKVKAINLYLNENSCSLEAQNFVIEAIETIIEGGDVDFYLQNINKLSNPCAKEIFNELEDGIYRENILSPEVQIPAYNIDLNFSETILALFNESETFTYITENGTPQNPDANAGTTVELISTNPNVYIITTIIKDAYLNNATQLSIARTMIHELVHAYLLNQSTSLDFSTAMSLYAYQNGIDTSNNNEFHHEFMGQYINAMAYSLYEWDKEYGTGSDLGWDYYYAMAFSGQFSVNPNGDIATTTDTFLELVPDANERQEIVDIVLNEQINNNDAQGTDCN